MGAEEEIRRYWDDDAATYDDSYQHHPTSPLVRAAWTSALARLLPPAPAKVLDCGAGTGFLSLMAARLGHRVTALDLSEQMLERLRRAARSENLEVRVVVGPAGSPPHGFDAVIERHLLWTLPDPAGALGAWRAAAPLGRLVLFESLWGDVDPFERVRGSARKTLARLRREPPHHHADYPSALRDALPLGTGTPPSRLCELAASAGWAEPRLERLRDVEWAERTALPLPERLVGVTPRVAISADSGVDLVS
ncbi:MAG: class I SAM-dependent methyltransferase [Acidimicrobiales bacterium]